MENWKKLLRNNFFLILLAGIILSFFYPAILLGKIPIPADTIVGMYHPWRDKIWDGFTAGVPYKNFLITDPVRQQYVWRKLAIDELKEGRLPLWNPYSFSGVPLLANFQSAPFYPLNILFFVLPFNLAWTILVILQPLLAAIFLYLYLRYMRVSTFGSFLGGFTFAFSGFSIAWLEWNTILATALWLPLILLSADKVILHLQDISKIKNQKSKIHIKYKKLIIWSSIFIFSLISSFFAGHLQIFFYSLLLVILYISIRVVTLSNNKIKALLLFVLCFLLFAVIASIQWIPTLQFILYSARDFDQGTFLKEGWFIPWQNLIQFLIPDFFGNPATGNYWGIWNYAEFIGYVGIAPLILALYALIFRRDKKTLFFGSFMFLALVFALPTPLARLPYELNLPFISTSQPTRLMYIIDFSLSILVALGFDQMTADKKYKRLLKIIFPIGLLFVIFWLVTSKMFNLNVDIPDLSIAKRNLILPMAFFIFGSALLMLLNSHKKNLYKAAEKLLLVLIVIELFRFGWKFTPFTKAEWIFPQTKILEYLSQQNDHYRVMAVDRQIMPPNFAAFYKLSDVAGYDPLYLSDYNQLVASWERNKPDISPASFNRIVTPANFESFITDLFGVKYILSLTPLKSSKLKYISREGDTYLYANQKVFPRAFLVENVSKVSNKQEMIDKIYNLKDDLRTTAVVLDDISVGSGKVQGDEKAEIMTYSPNRITINTFASDTRFLVLTDIYYPSWRAVIDGAPAKIYKTDFVLRGVVIPAGRHTVEFKNNLL